MNPQFEQSPGLRLPQPTESGSIQPAPEQASMPEQSGARPTVQATPNPLYAAQSPAVPQNDAATQALATATAAAANDDGSDNPNVDLEWINKAKRIVEQTRTDPHKQSSEISKFKADYLKVRHNVSIKVVEDNRT